MSTPSYPIRPRPEEDARFTHGLTWDVAEVLERHGYPPLDHWADLLDLKLALFGFLYNDRPGGAARCD